jgi:hypothetical protein
MARSGRWAGELLEQRPKLLARAAPGCVEIHQDRGRGLLDQGRKGLFGRLDHPDQGTKGAVKDAKILVGHAACVLDELLPPGTDL